MNEVKPADIKLVTDSLEQYLNHMIQTKNIDLQEFVNFMESVFKKAGYRQPPQGGGGPNILIIHDSGAGDFITHSGAIREIRRLYPTAHITLVVSKQGMELAENCPYANEVIPSVVWNTLGRSIIYAYNYYMRFAELLLRNRFDICFSFTTAASTFLLMYMSGAKIRVSYLFDNEKLINRYAFDIPKNYVMRLATNLSPMFNYGKQMPDICFSLVESLLHFPVANRELEVWYTPTEFATAKNFVSNLSRPLYALMMGASNPVRRYPPEKFAELVKMILNEEPTATFINLGGGQADEISAQILFQQLGEEIFNKHVVNLVNRSQYRLDAAIMSFCDIYIGNNTGTMWLACATKCPVLVAECLPKDLDTGYLDIPHLYSPYKVPAIAVQPKNALPECAVNKLHYHPYGCKFGKPHCITQIKPETLFKGFKLLKEKIAKKIIDTTYIC